MNRLSFGILEFGNRHSDQSSMHTILDVLDFAELAEQKGFSRFWLTEHHVYNPLIGWASPRMLLPLILQQTERIHVGTAGVLMNFHSPYQVALDFRLLANLFPGRCDLGFANGRPSPNIGQQMRCEQFSRYPDDFEFRVNRVARLFGEEESVLRKEQTIIPPAFGSTPDLYALGSSFRRNEWAVNNQMHMVKSTFHTLDSMDFDEYDVIARYRDEFARKHGYTPHAVIALAGSCVPDETTRKQVDEQMKKINYGRPIVNSIVATPDEFQERVWAIAKRYGVSEFVLREVGQHSDQQQESIGLISKSFGLLASQPAQRITV
ncbi:LLM class flavin-dependent oxidoreductase [Neolewinella agarilytica]|uniref:Luciferase family oxidoreductase, group 1 n=1 Tax=Neolewinella agarilytica TaxID=478744 RepID=A0A1H9KDF6_9BACT|nr:LLM class flavin-dependent oxidoreductase [Neolewinella agarilytica]SEQ97112.1 luciferase family oxidoreductase, group 1 [Neolewinella agarilytica]